MNCNNHITGSLPVHTMYTTDRLILKILTPDYTNDVLAFQCRNRELFERYEPTRPPYFLTPAHQQAILKSRTEMCIDPFLCLLKNQPADHHRNRLPARYSAHAVLLQRDRLQVRRRIPASGLRKRSRDKGFKHRFCRSFPAPRICPRDAGKHSLPPSFGGHRLHM